MLVIARKLNEKLQIGDNITIHVVNIHDGNVFLDITLPNGEVQCEVIGRDEEIEISKDVKVRAAEIIGSSKVRLGVTAPGEMGVKRVGE